MGFRSVIKYRGTGRLKGKMGVVVPFVLVGAVRGSGGQSGPVGAAVEGQ